MLQLEVLRNDPVFVLNILPKYDNYTSQFSPHFKGYIHTYLLSIVRIMKILASE